MHPNGVDQTTAIGSMNSAKIRRLKLRPDVNSSRSLTPQIVSVGRVVQLVNANLRFGRRILSKGFGVNSPGPRQVPWKNSLGCRGVIFTEIKLECEGARRFEERRVMILRNPLLVFLGRVGPR